MRYRTPLYCLILWAIATVVQAQTPTSVSLSSATCPGTGCAVISTNGNASIGLQVTGTFSGTIQFEQSNDGRTWVALSLPNVLTPSTPATSTTSAGMFVGSTAGVKEIRLRFSSHSSGTATIYPSKSLSRASTPGGASGDPFDLAAEHTFTGVNTFSGHPVTVDTLVASGSVGLSFSGDANHFIRALYDVVNDTTTDLTIDTEAIGTDGAESGSIYIKTGETLNSGDAGDIVIETGSSGGTTGGGGVSGDIELTTGAADGEGNTPGHVVISLGANPSDATAASYFQVYGQVAAAPLFQINDLTKDAIFGGGVAIPGALTVAMQTPATAGAACTKDTFAFDTGFLYVCTATNTWKRVAIATW